MIAVMLPVDARITGKFLATDYPPTWTPARPHHGVDFGCTRGTPVRHFTWSGRVYRVYGPGNPLGDGSFGRCVVVDIEETPWFVLYAHLSTVNVERGELVRTGDIIGLSGGSGIADGMFSDWAYPDHLHVQKSRSPSFPRDHDASGLRDMTGDPLAGLEENEAEMRAELDELREEVRKMRSLVTVDEATVKRLAGERFDEIVRAAGPGSLASFIEAVTDRFDAIHDGIRDGATVEEKLEAVRAATYLGRRPRRATADGEY